MFYAMPGLWIVGGVLTLLMLLDCAIKRRDLYWFFIIIALGPIGAIVYMVYHRHSLNFPVALPHISFRGAMRPGGKVCTRCFRQVARLEPYQDGRAMHYLCALCHGEMEILRADRLKVE